MKQLQWTGEKRVNRKRAKKNVNTKKRKKFNVDPNRTMDVVTNVVVLVTGKGSSKHWFKCVIKFVFTRLITATLTIPFWWGREIEKKEISRLSISLFPTQEEIISDLNFFYFEYHSL